MNNKTPDEICETRIRTAFIFALCEFERLFGDMWCHEEIMARAKGLEDLEPAELEAWEDYQELRKNILDMGNFQIRLAKKELNRVKVELFKGQVDG